MPLPVKLYQPTEITSSEILIKWNPTDAEDFREYKIFRSTSPGLDKTTGKLIYVSTSKMDTTFKDTKLASGLTYYYRVYMMNDLGRIGGSNIVHAQTKICNLIPDGDFEIVGSIYENWQSAWGDQKTFEYDDSIFVSGNYSLHGINPQSDGQQYPNTTDMHCRSRFKSYQFSR